ncbi:hypothetical protein QE422_003394 [Chryseobacterium sp. SORGH_AS 447]|nr:hypothetical protein [Chryseobacterium sp. SORGH_AS_0447]
MRVPQYLLILSVQPMAKNAMGFSSVNPTYFRYTLYVLSDK